ncbi:hypothetical protein [Pseudogemmobacter blasticus]|uniref:Uncharacterized protein n=1 Tax=Fuscovulum blasticum DSM 2131 TaxID=1188250 RepID=A0A2T4J5Q3_FUSBL|nr:hypothetical protein [Fuscovulum blasticum]PTE13183.1 hypothetical protein C5F44_14790 [Fuscovulum blasticum DSM 2131]
MEQQAPQDHDRPDQATRAFRRRVFYIPGYDPIHPRRYRELYRKEGTDQARICGYDLALTPKTTKGPYGWHVNGQFDGRATESDVEVLVWSDIVRESMSNTIPATYLQLVRTAWAYIGSGALFRLMKLRKGPMIAALYPIVFLLVQLLAALLVAGLAAALVSRFGHWAAGLLAGAAVLVLALRWFRSIDNKTYAYYLMHDYAFSALSGGANPPGLEARMAEFRAAIRAALDQDFDEVLVVGHSSGAHVGVSILSDLIRGGLPLHRPALAFLSLGQVVPMVSFLPGAHRLRADLRYLSARDDLTWVDVTAPGDGCAFALCDPVAVTGVAPANQRWPLVLSAAFTQTLTPARWKELRWRFFRLHFQYLCAFDALTGADGEYDYFRITAGPQTLAARYRDRAPSGSRITRAVNRHTSLT